MAETGKKGRKYSRLAAAAIVDKGLSAGALRVLAMLGIFADKAGYCYPAVTTMAHNLGIDRRHVQRYLRELEERHLIETQPTDRHTKGGSGRNRYYLRYSPVHLEQAPPRKDKMKRQRAGHASGAALDAAPNVPEDRAEKPEPGRRLETLGAALDAAQGAAFGDMRGGAGCRPIIPVKINPTDQPNEDQPSARARDLEKAIPYLRRVNQPIIELTLEQQAWQDRIAEAEAEAKLSGDRTKALEVMQRWSEWEDSR